MNFGRHRKWSELAKRIARGKQNKTQKQSYEKQHDKKLRFHRAGIKLITWIYFH